MVFYFINGEKLIYMKKTPCLFLWKDTIMNKRKIVLIVAVCCAVIFSAAAIIKKPSQGVEAALVATLPQEAKYIVSEHCGYVAVFMPDHSLPSYITETKVSTLPFADRQMLSSGILIFSEEELSHILEDYGS